MGKIRKPLFLAASILMLIAFAFLFHRALDPDRLCLQWEGIREVSFGSERVYNCNATNRLRRPKLAEPFREWVERLNGLSRLGWLMSSRAPIAVQIDIEDATVVEQNGARLKLGFRLAERPGHLERAVLSAWLNRNWPEHDGFTREVMADILTWTVLGDTAWNDPLRDESVPIAERMHFSLIPESAASYCLSPFRAESDLETCRQPREADWDTHRALRVLVSWSVWGYVKALPASEQVQFYRAFGHEHFQKEIENNEPNPQLWVQTEVTALLQRWNPGHEIHRPELRRVLNQENLVEPITYDLVVEVKATQLNDQAFQSLRRWLAGTPRKLVLFVSSDGKTVLPEGVRVDTKTEEIQAQRYVIVACTWPKVRDVLQLKSRFLYAIQACEESRLPSWPEIMNSEALHLPTLRQRSRDEKALRDFDFHMIPEEAGWATWASNP